MSARPLLCPRRERPHQSACRTQILPLTLLLTVALAARFAAAVEWPDPTWDAVTPASQSMDAAQLQKARDFALRGGGSGMIVRHGFLVYSWGSRTARYDLKSTTKSFGATALGIAAGDGRVTLSAKAQSYLATIGVPPTSNVATGWLDDITVIQLATQTAGFDKTGAEAAMLFKPGSKWGYSDGGPNWLADVLTTRYGKDLFTLMTARVFTPIGIRSADLTWRSNAYRSDTLNGIKRREFGSGISADVDAMARLGLLYLRGGVWQTTRIIPSSFVSQARTVPAFLAGLPVTLPAQYPAANSHYGLLWWNNADGRMTGVPRDTYWAWGLGDSLIIVIPSLDIVVARAGNPIRTTTATDPKALEPFLRPIVASTQPVTSTASSAGALALHAKSAGVDSGGSDSGNAAPIVSAGPDVTVVLPQNTITLAGSVSDDGQGGGALTTAWEDVSRAGALVSSPTDPTSLATFPAAGIYVLELSAFDGEMATRASMTVTVVDPAAPPAKLPVVTRASTQSRQVDGAPLQTTWLGFSQAGATDGALATLRIHIAKVLAPGRIEVHRVLGAWDAQTVTTRGPPLDPIPTATYTVERADSGLTLETDVTEAVSSWTRADAARGLALVGVSGNVVIAGGGADSSPEIRLDH